jgi:RNA polymerase sigma-70 factor, ECF subfamily
MRVKVKFRRRRRHPGGHLNASRTAFRQLMLEHQSMVFSIARRIVHDPLLAEEVAQDVFFQLYGQLASIQSGEHLVSWLRRVTVHRAIDEARRRLRRPQDFAAHSFDEPGMAEPASREPGTDPWITRRLRELIAALPTIPRTILVLRYQEEMTPDEIASLLNMPVSTVKSNLQRTLKLLRGRAQRIHV